MELYFTSHAELNSKIENGDFLYIVYSEYGSKIGITKKPLERLEQIRLGLPSQKVLLIGLYIGELATKFEKILHNKFKSKKIGGEWFHLKQIDLDFIENYLLENGFISLVRVSIVWANYLIPSIFLKGKVIEVIKQKGTKNINAKYEIPLFIKELIKNPTEDEIQNGNYIFMTATEISKFLEKKGFNYPLKLLGRSLTALRFRKVSKYNSHLGHSQKGYLLKIGDS